MNALGARKLNVREVERELGEEVEEVPLAHGLRTDEERADGVEEQLANDPHNLEERAAHGEHLRLAARGDIRVHGVVALEHVVLKVVLLERHRERDADGKIGDETEQAVRRGDLNARLWLSSWFARKRLAVAKPPMMYAQRISTGVEAFWPR